MLKKNYLIAGVVAIVLISVGITIFISQNRKTQTPSSNISISKPSDSNISTDKPTNTKTDSPSNKESVGLAVDLRVVKSNLNITPVEISEIEKTVIPSADSNNLLLCQPNDFDPATTKFTKKRDENITPSDFYELNNPKDLDKNNTFQINGSFTPQDQIKIKLPEPLIATQYNFGCASQIDTVLEIKVGDKQVGIFRGIAGEVQQSNFSKDGRYLYLNYWTTQINPLYKRFSIFDILNNKTLDVPYIYNDAINLPEIKCLGNGFWAGNELISVEQPNDSGYTRGQPINICVFDKSGKVIRGYTYPLNFTTASTQVLSSTITKIDSFIGIYNHETANLSQGDCILSVYNLASKTSKEAVISQSDQFGQCPDIEIQKLEDSRAVININDSRISNQN